MSFSKNTVVNKLLLIYFCFSSLVIFSVPSINSSFRIKRFDDNSSDPNGSILRKILVKRLVTTKETINEYRLPLNIKPVLYDVQLKPYIGPVEIYGNKSFTTEGRVVIHFSCEIPTNKIYIHAKELDIDINSLRINETGLGIESFDLDTRRDFAIIGLNSVCETGHYYALSLKFTGVLTDSFGLYRSAYKDLIKNQTYYLGVTQFEPSEARRVFPCMDEPALKAVFNFEIIRHENFTGIFFNTPLLSSSAYSESGWVIDKFKESVKMSTYLIGFVISNFKTLVGHSPKHGYRTEVAARPEAINAGEANLALSESMKIIDFFTDYFNMSYPLEKLTHIGVPDFFAGAMENWGIVIYREEFFLFDEAMDSFKKKKRMFEIIYHEVSHQWFGNIVSPAWWNDLWLNEGFASWFEYVGKNFTHPEWRDNDFFFVEKISVMIRDSLESSHSVKFEVFNPDEVRNLFDEISYDKGSSIIRMMNAFLTQSTTQKGLNTYLNKYAYKNAVQDSLWEVLDHQSHIDNRLDSVLNLKSIMDTWTLQKGYPVVEVIRNYEENTIKLNQSWFLMNPLNKVNKTEYNTYKWYVPFTYTTKDELKFDFETKPVWLTPDKSELIVNLSKNLTNKTWIIGNLKHSGFYRVNYDYSNWLLLTEQLHTNHKMIDCVSRATLIDDSFNLGRAEIIDQKIFLDIIGYLKFEEDHVPIQAAHYGLEFIGNMISRTDEFEFFKIFYNDIFENILYEFQKKKDSDMENHLDFQQSVIKSLCNFGHKNCIIFSRQFFSSFLNGTSSLPSGLETAVLQTIVKYGNDKDWHDIYDIAIKSNSFKERTSILSSLGHSRNPELIRIVLNMSANETLVRKHDQTFLIKEVAKNIHGQYIVIDYIDKNWDTLLEKFGSQVFTLPGLISSVFENLNTQADLDLIEAFILKHPGAGISSNEFINVVEKVNANKRWIDKYSSTIFTWLTSKNVSLNTKKESTPTNKPNDEINQTTNLTNYYRLPNSLVPILYDFLIQPNFTSITKPENFYATIRIDFKCIHQTNKLILNMKDLILNSSTLSVTSRTDSTFTTLKNFNYSHDHQSELFTAVFKEQYSFKPNNVYSFYVEFKGIIRDDNKGLYRSSYFEGENIKWLLVTQFECIEGRKAFISFDEPGLKAKFKLTIKHDQSLKAFSNMPVESFNNDQNWTTTEFFETPIMPLYSFGMVIADFTCQSTLINSEFSKKTINISVCARSNAMHKVQVLFNYSLNILNYYETYFNSAYPLSKIDHITVPDFNFGAMENWGMVIYKEDLIFFDEGQTPETHKEMIARVVFHEIIHMWLGNLVTMKWWDDLWLNEGFARYYDFMTTNVIFPEWQVSEFYISNLLSIMKIDSENVLSPISYEMNSPTEINTITNSYTTYGKGSAVVRLLNYILGENEMQRLLSSFLKKHEYGNVDQDDLWRHIEKEGGVKLGQKMMSWTKQRGHPVVKVTRLNDTFVQIEQNAFLRNLEDRNNSKHVNYLKQTWHIPFTYIIDCVSLSGPSFTNTINMNNMQTKFIWLDNSTTQLFQLDANFSSDSYILANLNFAAFYRVNYDHQNWMNIIKQLAINNSQISTTMRGQLINDAFALARSRHVDPILPLKLSAFLVNETEYLPWKTFLDQIKYYSNMLIISEYNGRLESFLRDLVAPMYETLGWLGIKGENWLHTKLREQVIGFACRQNLPHCVKKSIDYLNKWMANETIINLPGQLKVVALCTAVQHATLDQYEFLETKLRSSNTPKMDILKSLMCSKDPWRLKKYFIHDCNYSAAILKNVAVNKNPNGNGIVWDFIKSNWDELADLNEQQSLAELVFEVAKKFNTNDKLEEFMRFNEDKKKFFEKKKESLKVLRPVEGEIRLNIKWLQEMKENMDIQLDIIAKSIKKKDSKKEKTKTDSHRLPKSLTPYFYNIQIKPYIGPNNVYGDKAFTFEGQASINLTCFFSTSTIYIHSNNLNYTHINWAEAEQTESSIVIGGKAVSEDKEKQFLVIQLERKCSLGKNYTISFDYKGQINRKQLRGFYYSTHLNEKNEIIYIAATQFQPGYARQAFPCFDEPAMKARFQLSLIRHKNFTSTFHNTLRVSTLAYLNESDWLVDTFEPTVLMSTYLVGFVVSSLDTIETYSPKHKIKIEVAARPEVILKYDAEYSLNETSKIMDYFIDYFNVSYPLKKSTQIALPDFESSGMENWGVVMYRESSLLNFEKTKLQQRDITQLISHEIAHQWFGNLVTLEWWNDLWLNEGFATWVEYLGMDHSHPEWRSLEFFKFQTSICMEIDSLESSHPISVDVNDPNDINSLFDLISYYKGANIVRMMNAFLTESTFKKAITTYLRTYQFKTANQDSLWKELTNQGHADNTLQANLTIKEIMDTWTLKKGYPVIYVNRTAENQISVTQKWFLLNPLTNFSELAHDTYKWYIPFTYTTNQLDFSFDSKPAWLTPDQDQLIVDLPENSTNTTWIIANLKQAGFYRVNYNIQNWYLLIQQFHTDHTIIDVQSRSQLIEDVFNLGRAEIVDQTLFLDLVNYLSKENDPLPFMAAIRGLDFLHDMVSTNFTANKIFKDFYLRTMLPVYEKYGWRNDIEDINELSLQIKAIEIMCSLGMTECVETSQMLLDKWLERNEIDTKSVYVDHFTRIAICTAVMYSNDSSTFPLLMSSRFYDLIGYMTCSRNLDILRLILKLSADKTIMDTRERLWFISAISKNPVANQFAYNYIEENWDELHHNFNDSYELISLVEEMTKKFNTQYELERVEAFSSKKPISGSVEIAFKRAIERIKMNIRWKERNMNNFIETLANLELSKSQNEEEYSSDDFF